MNDGGSYIQKKDNFGELTNKIKMKKLELSPEMKAI